MKRRISELLDDMQEDTVVLEEFTPLSSRRIKELTMKKIYHNNKRRSGLGFKVLIAAAIIASMALTAFAAEHVFGAGDWFREVLNIQLRQDKVYAEEYGWDVTVRETLGQDQVELINDMGMVYENMTKVDQGTSITLNAAYADAYVMHLYFRVEAPQGTVLPDGISYHFGDVFGQGHDYLILEENAPYEALYRNVLIEALPDTDSGDNCKEFHMTITADADNELQFNDGVTKNLHITGIYEQKVNVNGDEDATVPLTLCDVYFDVTLSNTPKHIALDVQGLDYEGVYQRTYCHPEGITCRADCPPLNSDGSHTESWGYHVTPTRFVLSPMGVEWTINYTVENKYASAELAYTIVMKDGTSPVKARYDAGAMYNDTMAMGTDLFTVPIDLAQVDYIIIGNPEFGESHIVYLPDQD